MRMSTTLSGERKIRRSGRLALTRYMGAWGGAASGQMPNSWQLPTHGHLVRNFILTCGTTQPRISSMFFVEKHPHRQAPALAGDVLYS
jgi:hypothetical protein